MSKPRLDLSPSAHHRRLMDRTEQKLAFRVPMHQTANIERPKPPDTYPPIHGEHSNVGPVATGVGGLLVGGLQSEGLVRPPNETIQEHLAVIEAISDKDPEAAETLMRSHFKKSAASLMRDAAKLRPI